MRYRTSHELMARRVAAELKQGEVVTLGPGLPGMVPGYMAADRGAIFHAENGVLGYGRRQGEEEREPELVDGGGGPIGLSPGATIINQAESFGIVRGGYVDVASWRSSRSRSGETCGPERVFGARCRLWRTIGNRHGRKNPHRHDGAHHPGWRTQDSVGV